MVVQSAIFFLNVIVTSGHQGPSPSSADSQPSTLLKNQHHFTNSAQIPKACKVNCFAVINSTQLNEKHRNLTYLCNYEL